MSTYKAFYDLHGDDSNFNHFFELFEYIMINCDYDYGTYVDPDCDETPGKDFPILKVNNSWGS